MLEVAYTTFPWTETHDTQPSQKDVQELVIHWGGGVSDCQMQDNAGGSLGRRCQGGRVSEPPTAWL